MVKLDRTTAEYIIATGAAIDFLMEGKYSVPAARAIKTAARAAGRVLLPAAGRAGVSVAGATFGASRLLMTNPYILGATAIYVGVTERERIKQLLDQGYEIIREEGATFTPERVQQARERGTIQQPAFMEPLRERFLETIKKRRPSAFNKAVSAGMKAVKKSTSYGGKGKISPAKKAFALVVKLAAAKKKKKKAPKSGIRRRIWNAMKGLR